MQPIKPKLGTTYRSYGTSDGYLRIELIQRGSQTMFWLAIISFFMATVVLLWQVVAPEQVRITYLENLQALQQSNAAALEQQQGKPLVGIIVGHAGHDSGAVCPDGLTEVEVNTAIGLATADFLNSQGVRTDLLEEFDSRLTNYDAEALVSIHADSCTVPGVSGFKVARLSQSLIPEAEDQLVACLVTEYAKMTGLPEHTYSITENMTDYHAFREIATFTPGAIIETGFMLEDRAMLEYNPDLLARGIASGILCFLKSMEPDG
ncbi:MAG: N-acetylmuramoyl-L-alanine amidase [Chloroflexota bacterium]